MARMLDVYLHNDLVGHLTQDEGGETQFAYLESWLNRPGATPLSQSLPLRTKRFKRKECRAFFAGILPDEAKREIVARNLGISARNDYAMLERIGGECAGAVTFMPSGRPLPERNYGYRTLSTKELAAILRELPKRPLLAGEEGIRLSLAGAQDKIAVRIEDGEVCLPPGRRTQYAHSQTCRGAFRGRSLQRGAVHEGGSRSRSSHRRRGDEKCRRHGLLAGGAIRPDSHAGA